MIDTTPSLQCNETILADVFGWEDGTKGVWVLENPTQDQYDKLSKFPSTTNDTVYNGYLVCEFLKLSYHYPIRLSISTNVARPQSSKQSHTCDIDWSFVSAIHEQMAVTSSTIQKE